MSFALLLGGCATTSVRSGYLTYRLAEGDYLSLWQAAQKDGFILDYDTITRRVTLKKDGQDIRLMVGNKLAIVNNVVLEMPLPLRLYKGEPVISAGFWQEIKKTSKGITPDRQRKRIKKIILDPGHGGKDPGAISRGGLYEKDITLDISRRLAKLLQAEGIEVVMTHNQDTFLSLNERVRIANRSRGDLFVSIHINSNPVSSLKGFEVYYVHADIDDYRRALWAAENVKLPFAQTSFGDDSFVLKTILWDMLHTQNRYASIALAQALSASVLLNGVNEHILGVKPARFYVLKGACMPAVLVEVAFLSNSGEELRLRDPLYRQKVAEAIANGILKYSSERSLLAWKE